MTFRSWLPAACDATGIRGFGDSIMKSTGNTGREIVNRRTALAVTTVALSGAALSAGAAVAQQSRSKSSLLERGTLVSQELTPLNGAKRQIANPKGILMFDAGGRYAYVLVRGDRPKYQSPGAPTTEEIAANVRDYVAGNFGTWSVNETDKTLTLIMMVLSIPTTMGPRTRLL
jgi:hypothetical protein